MCANCLMQWLREVPLSSTSTESAMKASSRAPPYSHWKHAVCETSRPSKTSETRLRGGSFVLSYWAWPATTSSWIVLSSHIRNSCESWWSSLSKS